MKLQWYGHASFCLTSSRGTRVITDPYDPATSGYKPFAEPCDVVVISSTTDDFHNNTHLVPGEHITVDALSLARGARETTLGDVRVFAIEAMEAIDHRNFHPDQNGMYVIEMDGLRIGHMGDVGNALSAAQIAFFRGVDVLLALTGGHPTIALPDLLTLISEAKPRWVVPMHFRTLRYKPRSQFWVQTFLDHFATSQVDFACSDEVSFTRADLPDATRVMVLDHA
jgi:L-ascorbate metabolism protein UlaG (beta-lactamase superfamily)